MTEQRFVAINITIPEPLRDVLNSFVPWLNRWHPTRDLETGKRILWNQNTATTLVFENSELWHEFVNEEAEVARWHQEQMKK